MAMTERVSPRGRESYQRIAWGLGHDRGTAAQILNEVLQGNDHERAKASREIYKEMTGRTPPGDTINAETRRVMRPPSTICTGTWEPSIPTSGSKGSLILDVRGNSGGGFEASTAFRYFDLAPDAGADQTVIPSAAATPDQSHS